MSRVTVLDLIEARIRVMESGRIMLAIPGFSDEFFGTEDELTEKIELIIAGGQFADGMIIDDEVETRRTIRRERIGRCGSRDGLISTR